MESVILYGAGVEGEKWYVKYHKQYKIEFVLDKSRKKEFHGIPVYTLDEKKDELIYKVIVAMSVDNYHEVAITLLGLGLEEGRDFLWMECLNRKLMVLWGNCHTFILEGYFFNNAYLSREYAIIKFYICDEDKRLRIPRKGLLKHCDVFVTQDIRADNQVQLPSANKLIEEMEDGKACVYPNLYGFNFFYPQVTIRNPVISDTHAENIGKRIEDFSSSHRSIINHLSGCQDININKMYEEGKSIDEMLESMESPYTYNQSEVRLNFEHVLDKLKEREKECDIHIAEYIEENYKFKQLFCEPYHPTNILIYEMGRRILKFLDIKIDESIPVEMTLSGDEMFIYESVKNALGMQFEQEFIKKGRHVSSFTLENYPMNKKEWLINYLAWNFGELPE